jgi:hypothetical protein
MINAVDAPAKERSRKRRSDIVSRRQVEVKEAEMKRRSITPLTVLFDMHFRRSRKTSHEKYRNPCSRAELALWLLPKSVLSRRANQAPGD